MKKNLFLPVIIVVFLAGIIGVVVYAMNQNKSTTSTTTDTSMQGMDKMDNSTSVSTADAKETNTVSIENFNYTPSAIKVKVGTKVTWTNKDSVQHNVVGDSFTDLDGPLLKQGESFSYTFEEAGTYSYHCAPHTYMKGVVVVTE